VATFAYTVTATGITTGTPEAGTPTLTQGYVVTAGGLAATPDVGSAALTQFYGIVVAALSTGAPTLGSPAYFEGEPPPPVYIITVPAQSRRVTVGAGARVVEVAAQSRVFTVTEPD
jgi:hypothetical protein